ncbi:MAG: xanthine dehydrogenase molybdopterin binding subunit, partial [Bdellovibrio sp. CG_4_9_14_3_um_filter_39_7]
KVLAHKNIVAVFTGHDLHHNLWGTIFKDQPLLATDKVQFAGEPIALIVGSDLADCQRAKQLVEIEYNDLPKVMSIQEARSKKSFIADAR